MMLPRLHARDHRRARARNKPRAEPREIIRDFLRALEELCRRTGERHDEAEKR